MENVEKLEYSSESIKNMNERYRAAFINSLSGFKSGNMVGSIDKSSAGSLTNLAIFSSCFHLGASPPLLGLVSRPNATSRHTLDNIEKSGVYTINHINSGIFKKAHQTSARYSKETSEFHATGLTPEYIDNFEAPFVKESNLKIAMKLKQILPIEINQTQMIIGEIVNIIICPLKHNPIDEQTGHIDINKLDSIAISGLDHYHVTKSLGRLSYAKPDRPTKFI